MTAQAFAVARPLTTHAIAWIDPVPLCDSDEYPEPERVPCVARKGRADRRDRGAFVGKLMSPSPSTREVPTSMSDRITTAQQLYAAFAAGDRDVVDGILAAGFTFSSPVDVGLDRAGYFERCWPGAGLKQQFHFVRLVETDDEVVVTYEMTRADGGRGRNTEVLTFDGDRIVGAEVYFGWNL